MDSNRRLSFESVWAVADRLARDSLAQGHEVHVVLGVRRCGPPDERVFAARVSDRSAERLRKDRSDWSRSWATRVVRFVPGE
jgi:hypothetical protein